MDKFYILLVIALALDICFARNERIIGGVNANIQDHPYQVSMRWAYGAPKPTHFCGGSIINKNHIVTAAHCVDDKKFPNMFSYIRIYTGTSRSVSLGNEKAYHVKRITIHPGYRGARNFYFNDIAIITLTEDIEYNQSQMPIKLPSKNVRTGVQATVTGWGNTGRGMPLNLQKASMSLLVISQCRRYLPYYNLKDSQVCAIRSAGVGVCTGDSGGPLTVDGELVGIASYVHKCGKGYPDVYTNVYSFIDFINLVIRSRL